MTEDPAAAARRASVFLPAERRDAHIIDVLIEERCPSFSTHWSWPLVRPGLYQMLGYRKARAMAEELQELSGEQSFDFLKQELDLRVGVESLDRMPKTGRLIVAANHPTGLADGVAVWDALTRIRRDIVFFANADAMRVNRRFDETTIPVEWVMSKRSPAKTRETLRRAAEAFREEKCVVIFPSGKLAKMVDRQLTEQEWFSTVIGLARKQNAPILPLHITAKNSPLYYLFSNWNAELRDITLFYELLNKRRSRFDMACGPMIMPDDLEGDALALTERLKEHVAYHLKDNSDLEFQPADA